MSTHQLTVFEKTMHSYHAWNGEGEPPAYPLYDGEVVALVDKFPKFIGQVVIFPREGFAGEDVSLYDLPDHIRHGVDYVAHKIGQHMSRLFEGVRVIRHDEGYAVPDHPHTVLFPAARMAGQALYGPGTPAAPQYLEQVQEFLALSEEQTKTIDNHLANTAMIHLVEPT